jgi:hypothetical protein
MLTRREFERRLERVIAHSDADDAQAAGALSQS